jgi:hypothetical protein
MTIKIQALCEGASRYPYQKPIGFINHYPAPDKKEYVHRPGLMQKGGSKIGKLKRDGGESI